MTTADHPPADDPPADESSADGIPAGDFSAWLVELQGALRGERGSEVPCDGCTACCTASQFIPIGPDETATLARIPKALRFPAPGLPRGHVLLGYDERGHCPMLIEGRCSIYEDRPRTCRTYDCRVFPAAGRQVPEAGKAEIDARAARWQFTYDTPTGRAEHDAVRAAAAFLDDQAGALPDAIAPVTTTQLAVLAIEVHDLFLGAHDPDADDVRVEITRRARLGPGEGTGAEGGWAGGKKGRRRVNRGG